MTNQTYQVIKETPYSNSIVKELNAKVLTSTFKNRGIQKADLYTYKGTGCTNPDEIVAYNTCPPSLGIFTRTIEVQFN